MAESLNSMLVIRGIGTLDTPTYTMARAGTLVDAVVIATNGGAGTVTLQTNLAGAGLVSLSAALNPASTDTAVIRTLIGGVWTTAQKDLAVGDVVSFTNSAATLNFEAYAYLYPTPAVAE